MKKHPLLTLDSSRFPPDTCHIAALVHRNILAHITLTPKCLKDNQYGFSETNLADITHIGLDSNKRTYFT
eukprot:m.304949 g.304949  ORF g.304949 m.304949 type:complete len:70 (-) comp16443_c3_seq2:2325-2534(-)